MWLCLQKQKLRQTNTHRFRYRKSNYFILCAAKWTLIKDQDINESDQEIQQNYGIGTTKSLLEITIILYNLLLLSYMLNFVCLQSKLFDGFEEEDATLNSDIFVKRRSVKKLVIKKKSDKVSSVTVTDVMYIVKSLSCVVDSHI